MENFASFPFFTISKNQSDAKYVITILAINPIIYGNIKFELRALISSKLNINEPIETGKYSINEYLIDESLDNPISKHPTKTAPLLLIPGKSATISNNPIIIASLYVISSSFFLPLYLRTINNIIAVIMNATPSNFGLIKASIWSLNNIPAIAAGILPTTISKQYLKSFLMLLFDLFVLSVKYVIKDLMSLMISFLNMKNIAINDAKLSTISKVKSLNASVFNRYLNRYR